LFSITNLFRGSGYLAVYLAGIVVAEPPDARAQRSAVRGRMRRRGSRSW
jgi:NhaP-type Na+/H+ and K+/H+ antiporter